MLRRSIPVFLLLLSGLIPALWPAAGRAQDAPEMTLRQVSEQGIHYYRRKMLEPAMASLEKARSMPGGEKDYRTLSNLARVYYDLLLLEKAFPTAEAASAVAKESGQQEDARAFLDHLHERFGGVTFRKAHEQVGDLTRGIIHLEDRGGLIDPQKKKVFENIAKRFLSTEVDLPITLYLPFGSYAANRSPFTAEKGKVAEVELILYNLQEEGISPWWYVAGGALVVGAATTITLLLLSEEPPEDTQSLRVDSIRFGTARPANPGE